MKHDVVPEIQKTEEEWKAQLGPERYHILREAGTEAPFSGSLLASKRRRHVHVRRVRSAALHRRIEVRVALRLAELHPSRGTGERPAPRRLQPRHASHRSALQALRLTPRPRLRRRAGTRKEPAIASTRLRSTFSRRRGSSALRRARHLRGARRTPNRRRALRRIARDADGGSRSRRRC